MQRKGNLYTFIFAFIICAVCSFLLAAVSQGLRKEQEKNVALDIKKNILKAVGLREPLEKHASADEVFKIYDEKIESIVVDEEGNIIEGMIPEDIKEGDNDRYPLYIYKEEGKVIAYCFPVQGKGLWSTLYGYFALEPDAITVRGITFYKHGETPGLGAEIEKDWFQDNFKGKQIWSKKEDELTPTKVAKGKVAGMIAEDEQMHYVDGISGATMTGKGVTALIDKWLHVYEPFLAKIRSS